MSDTEAPSAVPPAEPEQEPQQERKESEKKKHGDESAGRSLLPAIQQQFERLRGELRDDADRRDRNIRERARKYTEAAQARAAEQRKKLAAAQPQKGRKRGGPARRPVESSDESSDEELPRRARRARPAFDPAAFRLPLQQPASSSWSLTDRQQKFAVAGAGLVFLAMGRGYLF